MAHFEMPVTDYMTRPVETIFRGEKLEEADRALRRSSISALAVTAGDGSLLGAVSIARASREPLLSACLFP
ncbi:MAG: CBS domain-containing protein [Proteobacteria bacterium]|nr:CBS domain-containing protein [Pseudomonadota bacterium]